MNSLSLIKSQNILLVATNQHTFLLFHGPINFAKNKISNAPLEMILSILFTQIITDYDCKSIRAIFNRAFKSNHPGASFTPEKYPIIFKQDPVSSDFMTHKAPSAISLRALRIIKHCTHSTPMYTSDTDPPSSIDIDSANMY